VAIQHHPQDSRLKISPDGLVETLTHSMGTGGHKTPLIMASVQAGAEIRENGATTLTTLHEPPILFAPRLAQDKETYALHGRVIGRESDKGPNGSGVLADVSYTLDTSDRHAVAYSSKTKESQEPGGVAPGEERDNSFSASSGYTIRRLTPLECSRLQGFPDFWCSDLATPSPTGEEIAHWQGIFEEYRQIAAPLTKPKSKKRVARWLKNPYSESAQYRMWGNCVALPCPVFVLSAIKEAAKMYTVSGDTGDKP
jgi:DNA (cytosine-5)-methyltransferase 1